MIRARYAEGDQTGSGGALQVRVQRPDTVGSVSPYTALSPSISDVGKMIAGTHTFPVARIGARAFGRLDRGLVHNGSAL